MTISPKDLLRVQVRAATQARSLIYLSEDRDPAPFFLAVLQVLAVLAEYPELSQEVAPHQLLDDYYSVAMLVLSTRHKDDPAAALSLCREALEISRFAAHLGIYGCRFSDRALEVFKEILKMPPGSDLRAIAIQGMYYLHSSTPTTKGFAPRSS